MPLVRIELTFKIIIIFLKLIIKSVTLFVDEMSCRYRRNCTWCPSLPSANIPWCFHSAALDSTGYVLDGEPMSTPDGITFALLKNFQDGRPFWDGEASRITLQAQFESDYRLRIKVGIFMECDVFRMT